MGLWVLSEQLIPGVFGGLFSPNQIVRAAAALRDLNARAYNGRGNYPKGVLRTTVYQDYQRWYSTIDKVIRRHDMFHDLDLNKPIY